MFEGAIINGQTLNVNKQRGSADTFSYDHDRHKQLSSQKLNLSLAD
ncbi:MAG: hypothetical protein LBN32_02050 [Helicobacteraceae bacterium]|jgi:hypothetical protein|nr:hypothetical protein [Helicobacteraceae bacterium]